MRAVKVSDVAEKPLDSATPISGWHGATAESAMSHITVSAAGSASKH